MHVIAAKAVAFGEALTDEFKAYQQRIVDNAKALCQWSSEQRADYCIRRNRQPPHACRSSESGTYRQRGGEDAG